MPFINGVKFACNSCIKGHRSSHCSHVERPLIEIRRKGRPVTQCAYCRHLRKTKQVHVKCLCSKSKQQRSKHTSPSTMSVEDNFNFQYYSKEEDDFAGTVSNTIAAAAAVATTTTTTTTTTTATATAAVAALTAYAQQQQASLMASSSPFALDEVVLSPWSAYMPQPPTPPPQDEQYCWFPSSPPFQWDCGASVESMSMLSAPSSHPMGLQSPSPPSPPNCLTTTVAGLPDYEVLEPESFMITITPLSPEDKPTITRVVTCNCGPSCMSPGCLVHSLTTSQQNAAAAAAAAAAVSSQNASSTIMLMPPSPAFVGVPC